MIVYQVLIAAALLLAVEAALRVDYTVQQDMAQELPWYVYAADVGWDRRPNYKGDDDCDAKRSFDSRGIPAFAGARPKDEGRDQLTVVFLGDSNTYGACREVEETFVAVASTLVPQARLVNLGMNGHTSYQGYKALLKHGEQIRPDLIFISFNMNDRRLVLSPELADSDALFRKLGSAELFRRLSAGSYFVRAAGEVGKLLIGGGNDVPYMVDDTETVSLRLDSVWPRVDPRGYRENLNKMVAWAKKHGSAVAFILLGDNPNQTQDLREGLKHLAAKKYHGAIAPLEEASHGDDVWFSALARLYLSKAYMESGRPEEAQEVLEMERAIAGLSGGYPIFLDSDYHRIMRDVAAEHGVPVVDAASELNKTPEVFWDYCHFDEKGHQIVGRLVAEAIETVLKGRVASK
jgi:lysophospholipase L1-like esterase